MKYISIDYVLKLHEKLIKATGGSIELRDMEPLKSAIENSKATVYTFSLTGEIMYLYLRLCK